MSSRNLKLYENIVNTVTEQIREGKYLPGEKLPTEMYFAREYGVSRITSKRALDELENLGLIYRKQGSGSYVAEREAPKPFGGAYDRQQNLSNTVSFILPYDELSGRFIDIVHSATAVFEEKGYHLTLHNKGNNPQSDRELVTLAKSNGARGIVFYPSHDTANVDLLYELSLYRYPFVTVDKKLLDLPISSVCADNFQGSYDLTNYLISKGHTKIACFYLVNMAGVYTVRNRFYGYCSALKDNGIGVNYDYIINDHYKLMYGRNQSEMYRIVGEAVERLLQLGVTAICAEHDYVAFDIYAAAAAKGIKIPQELSVVGFDDLLQSDSTSPRLTTVAQDFNAMGTITAKTLLNQIEDTDFQCRHHIVPVKLHERDSVKELNR